MQNNTNTVTNSSFLAELSTPNNSFKKAPVFFNNLITPYNISHNKFLSFNTLVIKELLKDYKDDEQNLTEISNNIQLISEQEYKILQNFYKTKYDLTEDEKTKILNVIFKFNYRILEMQNALKNKNLQKLDINTLKSKINNTNPTIDNNTKDFYNRIVNYLEINKLNPFSISSHKHRNAKKNIKMYKLCSNLLDIHNLKNNNHSNFNRLVHTKIHGLNDETICTHKIPEYLDQDQYKTLSDYYNKLAQYDDIIKNIDLTRLFLSFFVPSAFVGTVIAVAGVITGSGLGALLAMIIIDLAMILINNSCVKKLKGPKDQKAQLKQNNDEDVKKIIDNLATKITQEYKQYSMSVVQLQDDDKNSLLEFYNCTNHYALIFNAKVKHELKKTDELNKTDLKPNINKDYLDQKSTNITTTPDNTSNEIDEKVNETSTNITKTKDYTSININQTQIVVDDTSLKDQQNPTITERLHLLTNNTNKFKNESNSFAANELAKKNKHKTTREIS
jgi:hypothetical protein